MVNIQDLLNAGAAVNLTVTATDLKEFALSLIDEAKRQLEAKPKEDKELTAAQAAKALGISTNSLWRWERDGYLKPASRVGKRPIYLQSQIDELKGKKG